MAKKANHPQSKITASIFSAKITTDDLVMALEVWAKMPEADRKEYDARTVALLPQIAGPPGQRRSDDDIQKNANKLSGIMFRMEALARLAHLPQFKGWSLPAAEQGAEYVNHSVLEAAAAEPLIEVNGRPEFDPDKFFERLLYISEKAGSG